MKPSHTPHSERLPIEMGLTDCQPMHIAILGPIGCADLSRHLGIEACDLPAGYPGAPILAALIDSLLSLGHRVTAITTDASLPWDHPVWRASNGQLELRVLPRRPNGYRPTFQHPIGCAVDGFRLERGRMVAEIVGVAPDVVHAHWTYEFAAAAIEASIPHVVTCHDNPLAVAIHSGSIYRWMRLMMALRVLRRARQLTAVSPYVAQAVSRWSRARPEVVPNPVRPAARGREATAAGRANLFMVSTWGRLKNPKVTLEAYALVRRELPHARLFAAGPGFEANGLAARWCSARGLDQGVIFAGVLAHSELLAQLGECDLLVHSSREESFGMVVAEALAHGVPVVGGRVTGAVPWLVGRYGVLVDRLKPRLLARAIVDAMSDPTLRELVRAEAPRDVNQRFAPTEVARSYVASYRRAILRPTTEIGSS